MIKPLKIEQVDDVAWGTRIRIYRDNYRAFDHAIFLNDAWVQLTPSEEAPESDIMGESVFIGIDVLVCGETYVRENEIHYSAIVLCDENWKPLGQD